MPDRPAGRHRDGTAAGPERSGRAGPTETASTTPKITLWLAMAVISTIRQSQDTIAVDRAGAPVVSFFHSPTLNRSANTAPVRPAKVSAIASSAERSVLTQKMPFIDSIAAA